MQEEAFRVRLGPHGQWARGVLGQGRGSCDAKQVAGAFRQSRAENPAAATPAPRACLHVPWTKSGVMFTWLGEGRCRCGAVLSMWQVGHHHLS